MGHVAQTWQWPNFTRSEMSCRHCGEYYHDVDFMHKLQSARTLIDKPFQIVSAHRCARHNALVGGRPKSEHLKMAVDISLTGHNRTELRRVLKDVGFTGFGYAQTFIHVDMGRRRHWFYGPESRKLWQS